MTHDPHASARMAQHFESHKHEIAARNHIAADDRRWNPVAVVLMCAALVAVLATVLALLT